MQVKASDYKVRKVNKLLLKRLYSAHLASLRNAHAKTKKRDEVRGGGRKPWRQKGTGRARIGSIRAPHWTGGGVVFGPTGTENWQVKFNIKTKQKMLRDALWLKVKEGKVITHDEPEKLVKTKDAKKLISEITKTVNDKPLKNIIAVVPQKSLSVKAFKNLSGVKSVYVSGLNIKDLIDADLLILFGDTKKVLETIK